MVSGSKQAIIVTRDYKTVSHDCVRAVELLLKKSVKEGGPATAPRTTGKDQE